MIVGNDSGSAYIFDAAARLTEDTGVNLRDRVTSHATPELTAVFTESIFGQDDDVTVHDPNGAPVLPDRVTGWGSDVLTLHFDTPLTVEGDYTVMLRGSGTMTDAAGNPLRGGGDDVVMVFTLDTVAPASPVAPDLAALSDTGISNVDNLTNDATPTFHAAGARLLPLVLRRHVNQ